jgi:hypothetical protein
MLSRAKVALTAGTAEKTALQRSWTLAERRLLAVGEGSPNSQQRSSRRVPSFRE